MFGLIISICTLIIVCFLIIYGNYYRKKIKKAAYISFRDSMRLTELPIISFDDTHGNVFNFLLDTGSNWSHINKKLIDENKISYKKTEGTIGVYGMDGINRKNSICTIKLIYNNTTFEDDFQVNDLEAAFSAIKAESGVNISGILGSKFFNKYGYILDFSNLVAYTK